MYLHTQDATEQALYILRLSPIAHPWAAREKDLSLSCRMVTNVTMGRVKDFTDAALRE